MAEPTPGQDSGQPFSWAEYVAWIVRSHGTLAAAAEHLVDARGGHEAVESVERALRRLRGRDGDGGVWGGRCLRLLGLPDDVRARLRFMGRYHSRFTDLPTSVCAELLRAWDRPPASLSTARVWLGLGFASVALRERRWDDAAARLQALPKGDPEADVERLLSAAFLASRRREASADLVDAAEARLADVAPGDDRACWTARIVDMRGYVLNVVEGDHEGAHALYASLPVDGPHFAVVRRHNGLGWSALRMGRRDEARKHARRSLEAAGDGGFLRLRAMALRLLAETADGPEAERARERARRIARELEDPTLVRRTRGATRPS